MPIFEYRCPTCRGVTEAYRPIEERHDTPNCACGSNEATYLIISPVAGFGDLPGYQSPVSGKWIEGRRQREEDFKRTGCRPYEGRDQELKEGKRHERYADEKLDRSLEKAAQLALSSMTPEQRTILNGD